jgi:alpha-L-fucosidase
MSKYLFLLLFLASCSQSVKTPPAAIEPVPSERQLAWHELEYYAFVHFNMNTFSDMEWGMGDESPADFNPTELDTRQWAKVMGDAGRM